MQLTAVTTRTAFVSMLMIGCMLISACGFQLRGINSSLSFKTIKLAGASLSLKRELTRNITANNLQLVDDVKQADVILELISESNRKRIQSLSGTGVVREFELYYQVNFRMREQANEQWGAPQTLQLRRDYSYNDDAILGKAEEEVRLNDAMRSDAVREIMRRLSFIKKAQ